MIKLIHEFSNLAKNLLSNLGKGTFSNSDHLLITTTILRSLQLLKLLVHNLPTTDNIFASLWWSLYIELTVHLQKNYVLHMQSKNEKLNLIETYKMYVFSCICRHLLHGRTTKCELFPRPWIRQLPCGRCNVSFSGLGHYNVFCKKIFYLTDLSFYISSYYLYTSSYQKKSRISL